MKTERGIDYHLDSLRSGSADLVAALEAGADVLSTATPLADANVNTSAMRTVGFSHTGSDSNVRQSESKAAFVEWSLPTNSDIAQTVRPEKWSNTMNLQNEYMDPREWKSEYQAAQHCTEEAFDNENVAPNPAGVRKDSDVKSPAFFAWTLDAAAALNAEMEDDVTSHTGSATSMDESRDGWVRSGQGWKSSTGIFYSDDDLIADVLTKVAADVEAGADIDNADAPVVVTDGEEEEEDEEDEEDQYCTEAEDQYRWSVPQPEVNHVPAGSSNKDTLVISDNCENDWISEYNSQSMNINAEAAKWSGAIAGQASGQAGKASNPLCFSWSRTKKSPAANSGSANKAPVAVVPPFGVSAEDDEWKSVYDDNFVEATAVAAAPAITTKASVKPTAEINVAGKEAWVSEYNSRFRQGGEEETAAPVQRRNSACITEQQAAYVAGSEVTPVVHASSPVNNVGAVLPAPKQQQKGVLSFKSEASTAFAWPQHVQKIAPRVVTDHVVIEPIPEKPATVAAVALTEEQLAVIRECFTTEYDGNFTADKQNDGSQRASRARGNLSNMSDPGLLAHPIVSVYAVSDNEEQDEDEDKEEEEDEEEEQKKVDEGNNNETAAVAKEEEEAAPGTVAAIAEEPAAYEWEEDESAVTRMTGPPMLVQGKSILRMRDHAQVISPESPATKPRPNKSHLRGKAAMLEAHRKASRAAALGHLYNSKNSKKNGKSPLTKNRRFPGTSDAQNLRFRSEAMSQFRWHPSPLKLK